MRFRLGSEGHRLDHSTADVAVMGEDEYLTDTSLCQVASEAFPVSQFGVPIGRFLRCSLLSKEVHLPISKWRMRESPVRWSKEEEQGERSCDICVCVCV